MAWIAKNTTIPVPAVLAYDNSNANPIAHEHTLLSRVEGVTLSEIYQSSDEHQIDSILDQLADFLAQLHAHDWDA